jgi:hypothetical protein
VKALVAILVVLALLGGAFVAVDRVAVGFADSAISQVLTSSLRLSQEPTTKIQGFPFLTQWGSGSYQEIDVSAPSVTSNSVTVDQVTAIVRGVVAPAFATSPSQFAGATARQITLTGTVPFSELPVPPGFQARADGGQLEVTGTESLFGVQAQVTALVSVHVSGSRVTFQPTSVQVAGSPLGASIVRAITARLQQTISIGQLPFGVSVTDLAVTPAGLAVTGAATNASFSG